MYYLIKLFLTNLNPKMMKMQLKNLTVMHIRDIRDEFDFYAMTNEFYTKNDLSAANRD